SLVPIAGTTEPTEGDVERLLSSEKDRAEHVMLVDLGRNDLSRVCRGGTVHVARSMEVERFSHVSHLVSEVVGELRDGVAPFDLLRACFPAGAVSGAAEVRAGAVAAPGVVRLARCRASAARGVIAGSRTPAPSSRCGRTGRWMRA